MILDESGEELPPAHWLGHVTGYPDQSSIPELFARHVAAAPAATAVADCRRRLSYAELDRWSDGLAVRLDEAGVRPGDAVGLLGERCLEAPAAMLAIMKTGAAYVPLDPSDPEVRLRTLIAETGIEHLIRLPGTAGVLEDASSLDVAEHRDGSPWRPRTEIHGGDPAYIMFTSGSTGAPKAVAVPHRAVARLVISTDYLQINPADRVTYTGHPTFDATVFEIWGALLNGAQLLIVDHETLLEPARLARLIIEETATVMWLTAGVFHHCARTLPAMFAPLRCLIAGGDVLDPGLVRRVLLDGPPDRLLNGYGPTENTTFSTTHHITDVPAGAARIPIGRPIANSTCHILDATGEPVPIGVEGELWVGGDGVALGYVNDPTSTAERFLPDHRGHRRAARLFRTGDRARWLPGGDIDFLGRLDRMVKIRGFRIELDEIEAALAGLDGVAAAAVTVTGGDADTRTVVAFYQPAPAESPAGPASPTVPEIRAALATRLPGFMLPGQIVALDRLPLAATGKVDRASLTALASAAVPGRSPSSPAQASRPWTPIETGIARLWVDVLDVESGEVGLDDSFFDLGGNSLLAARLFARLQAMFGVDATQSRLLTSRLLADPTLAGCATAVQQARAGLLARDNAALESDIQRESGTNTGSTAQPEKTTPPPNTARRHAPVLLTGATGFLGGYLLRQLVDTTDADIYCLVRAEDTEQARLRLTAGQRRYQLGDLPPARVRPLPGDLGLPNLGLPAARFDELTDRLGLILHAGAYVNFTYPYSQLAPVTVGGTREIVRLATPNRVPVHFVSTLAVLAGFGAAGVSGVSEDTPLAYPEHLFMGYPETKWVAEKVLGRAASAGLPVGIHRPYEISGDLTSGAWNLENATCALLRLIVDIGSEPDADIPLDLVPVDVLAAQIVYIATRSPAASRTYHLTNPKPATLRDMTDVLRRHGYRIQPLPLREWVTQAVAFVADNPRHPFTPFVPLWVDRSPHSGLVVKEMYFTANFPHFTRHNTEQALAGSAISMPPVDTDLLDHYVRFFRRCGYFPEPA
ncbi:amino acid adenylation domain-containing SDR family oxidoreductase [Actinoplanes sp. NPDC026670]|uniref:amino acid adenylation domain-containing SDR family oxidoreductase n=1 Tax=Actinoplanes sp. NPDC026670 TaxID=3154700 RepID=UPI0033FD8EF3